MPQITEPKTAEIVDRYLAVWREPEAEDRSAAVASLWAPDGAEFVEGAQFRGHGALDARVAESYQEFVADRGYAITSAGDVTRHGDIVTFTVQLSAPSGEVVWAARVFLLLDDDGLIREDYQLTVQPLPA